MRLKILSSSSCPVALALLPGKVSCNSSSDPNPVIRLVSSAKFCVALVDINQIEGLFFNIQIYFFFAVSPQFEKWSQKGQFYLLECLDFLSNQRESVNPGALFKCYSLAEMKFFDNWHR